MSEIASRFYKSKPKNILAVTGTNGKTSVSDLFYQLFRANDLSAASIGTLGIKYNGKKIKTNLTSPDTITLHKNLHHLKKKIDNVILEASSHGLDQKRLHHIKFKGAIFTNFSQDHLDYHQNMKSYLKAKLILFREILNKKSYIVTDKKIDQFEIIKKIAKKKNLKLIDIWKRNNQNDNIDLNLNDDFRLKNLAMAIAGAKICGLKNKQILKGTKNIKNVNGRLELIKKFQNNVKVFIDYAHTPDALLKTIEFLKFNYGHNISVVFGCGGDRDQKKRSLMGKIANKNCKKIYVTDDNPRNEDPKKIRREISKYIVKDKTFDIGNRKLAIKKAIYEADPNDIILIAGKGHEEQQIYKNKKIKISDRKIINKLKKLRKSFQKKQNYLQNKLIVKKLFGVDKKINFNGLSIDTRTIKKDNLFLTIKGKKRDGNNFISKAIQKGAGCIVSSKKSKNYKQNLIKINNPILFLNKFAKLKREHSAAKIIAITGSAGKTSLKVLIKDLLQKFGKTYSSPKSFNNHLGVPISLSNLSSNDKFGVFEVGMSKAGEISKLSKLIKPDIGIITNIGEAHIENFKSIKGIAKAKSEIIANIKKGGKIILNRDDKFFNYLYKKAGKFNLKICTYGFHKKSDIRVKKIIKIKDNLSNALIQLGKKNILFNISDLNIYNVLASLAVLKQLNLNLNRVKRKFKNFNSPEGRGKKYSISRYQKNFHLIDESYNANPLSVKVLLKD